MNAIWVTDLHINDYKAFGQHRNRLEDCLKVIDDCYNLAVKKKAKVILMSGDMFDTTKYLYTTVLTATIERLDSWIAQYPDIKWLAITGNHDFATKNLPHSPAISSLTHLAIAFPKNFIVIDNEGMTLPGRCRVQGIPNYEYKEHYQAALEQATQHVETSAGFTNILMIHQKPSGMHNKHCKIDTDVSDPLYDAFDIVLCGDIHERQIITPKFILGGNPLHRDLNDEGKEKGIWSLDLTNPVDTLKFHSRKGRYPEFIRSASNNPDGDNFVIVEPKKTTKEVKGVAAMEQFASSLPHADLLTNFWKEQSGTDKALLQTGLSFIK